MLYIDILKDIIPYEFEMSLKGETFQFEINYNTVGDFFTVNLFKDHNPIVLGEKLVYGVPMFEVTKYKDIPKVVIIPFDTTKPRRKHAERITYENLNEDVFLYVMD